MTKIKKILAKALSLSLILSTVAGVGQPSQAVKAADTNQRQLVWSDEFDGNSLNTNNWTYETGTGSGGWGNNEYEYYTDRTDNVSVSNGELNITAKKESYQGSNYTSGRIKTAGKQEFKYGRIEAKIKMPSGSGLWPAFWMLGGNIDEISWPRCGEIDIMEHINAESKIYGTAHWQASGGYANSGSNIDNIDVTQYHVYAIDWNENGIVWTVDGTEFHRVSITSDTDSMEEFHKKQFILLNLAVGGNWPKWDIDDTKMPATMSVDYVRVYQTPTEAEGNYGTLKIDDSTNLIKNPEFKYGIQGWTTYVGSGWMYANASYDTSLEDGISIKMKNIGGWIGTDTKWGVQLYQEGIQLKGGQDYSLRYKIHSNKDKNVSVYVTDVDTNKTYYTGEYKMSAYETKDVLVNLASVSNDIKNAKISFAAGAQGDDIANNACVLNITELKLARTSEIGTLSETEVPTITPLLATGEYADWKNTAIVYPQAGQLIPAGPIDLRWKNLKGVTKNYSVYVDDQLITTINASADDIMTYKMYSTDKNQHELKIVANLNDGSKTVTANLRTFFISKKGMGTGELNRIEDTGLSWYYHWATDPLVGINPQTEFIPMIWGTGDYGTNFLADSANKKYKAILGYNEPDFKEQSNVSVDTAVAELPRYINSGIRVGSPVTGIPAPYSSWFSEYMDKIHAKNLDVDFIVLHEYLDVANPDAFLKMVDDTYNKWGKPIWITEFGCAEWSKGTFSGSDENAKAQVRAFMERVLPELDKRPYVERYAWFPFDDTDKWGGASGLYDVGTGELNRLGALYRSLGNPDGYILPQLDGYKPITDFQQDAIVNDATGEVTRPEQAEQKVATPVITPGTGTFATPQTVTISNGTEGAIIRYTTDGSTPTATTGTQYSEPITVSATTTIKAIAFKSGMADSYIASSVITIGEITPINENIALNKQTSASSFRDGNTEKFAFDSDENTRWESDWTDDQWISVDLGSSYSVTGVKLKWEIASGKDYKIQVSKDNINWIDAYTKTNGTGGEERITFDTPVTGQYVRMKGTARTTGYGYSLWDFEVYGTPATVNPENKNIALNKAVSASSFKSGNTAEFAFDSDNENTRWESDWTDDQWISVDLGSSYSVTGAKLIWETAAGKDYKIQVSKDNINWVDAYTKIAGTGGIEGITFDSPVTGQYVRMKGTARTTGYGYSLWGFEVYGK